MNSDVARLLAQICGVNPQARLLLPTNVNSTSVTTQVSLPGRSHPGNSLAPSSSTKPTTSSSGSSYQVSDTTTGSVPVDLTIKVINPKHKRETKTYILRSVTLNSVTTLKRLKEIVFEQLGKNVVCFSLHFDIGYVKGSSKICFSQSDDIKMELVKVQKHGYSLWCEGLDVSQKRPLTVSKDNSIVLDDSDDDAYEPPKKKEKKSAFEERKESVQKIADGLLKKHGSMLNMVQYRLWAEALHSKQHVSWEEPPKGLPWGDGKKLKFNKSKEGASKSAADSVMHSFADMASTIATALKPSAVTPLSSKSAGSPPSSKASGSAPCVGISPGRKIDLQEKLLKQVDLLHKMFERGAITSDQFEQRRESVMKQLQSLD